LDWKALKIKKSVGNRKIGSERVNLPEPSGPHSSVMGMLILLGKDFLRYTKFQSTPPATLLESLNRSVFEFQSS
jgi:hypothetical protein